MYVEFVSFKPTQHRNVIFYQSTNIGIELEFNTISVAGTIDLSFDINKSPIESIETGSRIMTIHYRFLWFRILEMK